MEIGAGIVAGGGAGRGLVQRARILAVAGIAQVDPAVAGIGEAVAAGAGRHDAVEHVDAAHHRAHQVVGRADAHEVARLGGGQMRFHRLDHPEHHLLRLAHREAADGVALEVEIGERPGALHSQVGQVAALDDAEHRLARLLAEPDPAALGPAQGQAHGALDGAALGREAHAFVELHLDVRAEKSLDLDGAFGAHVVGRPVHMRTEGDALLVEFPQGGERHHLEPAGIGEDRVRPVHEMVETAEPLHALRAGAQHQVVGVAEHHVGAEVSDLARIHRLDGGRRPHRHEGRRADRAPRHRDRPGAGLPVGGVDAEGEVRRGGGAGIGHRRRAVCLYRRPSGEAGSSA
ncbi:hypothetical protein AIGOOFII_2684 [Methylobacterium marchantiae]|nr:hypothetical protein AIGOOFII_2684 [Methylobacterium marchantiae]